MERKQAWDRDHRMGQRWGEVDRYGEVARMAAGRVPEGVRTSRINQTVGQEVDTGSFLRLGGGGRGALHRMAPLAEVEPPYQPEWTEYFEILPAT